MRRRTRLTNHPLEANRRAPMRRDLYGLAVALLSMWAGNPASGQQQTTLRVQLSGYIRDAASRELIRYAVVDTDGDSVRTRSNTDGFYFLSLASGDRKSVV